MKSVIFINQSLGIGGAETFNLGLLVWFQKQNLKVMAFVTNKTFQKELISSGIETKHIPLIVDIIGNWKGLTKGIVLFLPAFFYYSYLTFKNRKTNIILMSGFIEKILVTPVAKILHIPVYWIEFAPLSSVFNKFFGFPKLLYSLVQNLPEKFIIPSLYTLNSLQKDTGLSREKFELISCGREVYKSYLPPQSYESNHVVCVSRLEKGKGQDLLLKAWPSVLKKIPKATLSIVGEGDFLFELKKIVKELGIEKSVIFTGYAKDALIEISQSTVVVFPTLWPLEGFGLTAVEAMALEKPVVCFDFGPLPEIVDSSCGIVVEAGNISALANAIIKLLNSSVLRKKLGEEGRKKYLREYSFEVVGPKYLKTIWIIK